MPIKPVLLAVLASASWLASLMPSHAVCVAPGFNPAGNFCNGCKYEGAMSVPRDQVCERPFDSGRANPIEFLGNRVLSKARHGIAGLNGTVFAYAPAKGYVGSDEFAIEVAYRQNGQTGKFIVHWNVTVQ